jgi:hypothetical protein
LAAEAALDLIGGTERAALLLHLDGCEACRELVHQLSATADDLVLLAPESEPPAGFEQRVLARLGADRRRRWPVVAGAAAAVLLLVVGFALGDARRNEGANVREVAMRTPSGRVVGDAYLHEGDPSFVFAAVPGWKDELTEYKLRVTLSDGSTTQATGAGSWGTIVASSSGVRSVVLIGADGRVWCSASL